jgi:hypothetical protein
MGTRPKFDRMYSTPEKVRASVRKAVSFGKWFPLYASGATERAEPECAPSRDPLAFLKFIYELPPSPTQPRLSAPRESGVVANDEADAGVS